MLEETLRPKILPPLDQAFCPAALFNRDFRSKVAEVGVPLVIGLERKGNEFSRYETQVFPEGHPNFSDNFFYVERLVKIFTVAARWIQTLQSVARRRLVRPFKKAMRNMGNALLTFILWVNKSTSLTLRWWSVIPLKCPFPGDWKVWE